jgi:hypothetical protein
MSYEKTRSVVFKPNEKLIELVVASNNVRPLIWSKCKYQNDKLTWEELVQDFIIDVLQGNLHLENSVNERIRNAIAYARSTVKEDLYYKQDYLYLKEKANVLNVELPNAIDNDYEKWYWSDGIREFTKVANEKLDSRSEFWSGIFNKCRRESYQEVFNEFMKAYNDKLHCGERYVIKFNGECYLTKVNERTYRYAYYLSQGKKYDYAQALKITQDTYTFRNAEMIKVEG